MNRQVETITNLFEGNQIRSARDSFKYKNFKGIRKESLRYNITDIGVALTDLGEMAIRDLLKDINLMD